MPEKFRPMKKYHPRRSSAEIQLYKQQLSSLEHKIKADLGEMLVFLKEGPVEQVRSCAKKTRDDLLKFGPDMQKIAMDIGIPFPKIVYAFLDSIDKILIAQEQSTPSPYYLWIDEAKIQSCYLATEKLEKVLFKNKKS